MDYERIILEFKDNIVTLTLNHPEALNAVSTQMLSEITDAMTRIEDPDNGARCLVITGAGRAFCAGANLADRVKSGSLEEESDGPSVLEKWYHPIFLRLRDLRMPYITAVNGPAAGVGMSIAISADLVLAGRSAYFLQAFRQVGLVPDGGATYLLPRLIGVARSKELSLLAERLPAEKALEWGMINRVFEDDQLMEEATKMAENLAGGPTVAFSLMRKAYWKSLDNNSVDQLELEDGYQKALHATEDAKEGPNAFLEKRKPQFKGR